MNDEKRLRIIEGLLAAEVDNLARYNRLLEQLTEIEGLSFIRSLRDDQLRRVDLVRERIDTYRTILGVGA
jgi:hypothetical protein